MRVVFDTNIFISALAIPGGMAEKAVSRVIEGHDELVISPQIIKEVLSVLTAEKNYAVSNGTKAYQCRRSTNRHF